MGWSLFLARCSRSACYRVSQPFLGSLEHNASPCFCLIQQNLSYLCPRFPPLAAVVPSWGYWANNSQELLWITELSCPIQLCLKDPCFEQNTGTIWVLWKSGDSGWISCNILAHFSVSVGQDLSHLLAYASLSFRYHYWGKIWLEKWYETAF